MKLNILFICCLMLVITSCKQETAPEQPEATFTKVEEVETEKTEIEGDEIAKVEEISEEESIEKEVKETTPVPKVGTKTVATTKKETQVKTSRKGPQISFEKTLHDFGSIPRGDKVDYTFKFTNTGGSELVISNAKATCGCTRPSFPFLPIGPGETGEIAVRFNSKGKIGHQKPAVTLTTNAYPRMVKLYLEGDITEPVKEKEAPELLADPMVDTVKTEIKSSENTTKGNN